MTESHNEWHQNYNLYVAGTILVLLNLLIWLEMP